MRSQQSGFTIIEMIIVAIVIVILAVLGTVSMTGYQKSAQDNERAQDVKNVKRSLEAYYLKGNPHVLTNTKGTYPSTVEIKHIFGRLNDTGGGRFDPENSMSSPYYADVLPGLTVPTISPPTLDKQSTLYTSDEASSIATLLSEGKYVYKPLQRPNTADSAGTESSSNDCVTVGACNAFVLFYKDSNGDTQKIWSDKR